MIPMASPLPVDAVIAELLAALDGRGVAVLQAPPGSGKTTRVPLALLGAPWLGGRRILVLEPRRVAARAAARRMAWSLGEELGGQVGYRIRDERVTGAATRVEVVTEGVLTRMLQSDPALDGVGAVVFDEFHERTITADLGLALSLDARAALRGDLRIVVMSATLDTAAVAALLDFAPVVVTSAFAYPVTTVWVGRPAGRVDAAVARTMMRALAAASGDVLAFLPGAAEIRAVARFLEADNGTALAAAGVDVVTLFGAMSGPAQDAALRAAPAGRRKVILATSIAETSVTIDGVGIVVDSGLMRVPRFDPAAGMTRLVTLPVSRAAAEQRQGRAGRQGPGVCFRLWSETDHAGLPRATPPEILVADLAPLALDLAEWGVRDPGELRWIDPPPTGPLAAARRVLTDLGAIDDTGQITAHGRAMARLGVSPRLGHMLLWAREAEAGAPGLLVLACAVAAVLSEGDPDRDGSDAGGSGGRDADLARRVDAVRRGRAPRHADAARRWQRLLVPPSGAGTRGPSGAVAPEDVGRLVATAYPDRVGQLRPGRRGQWLLRNGRGAWVPETDPLAAAPWIAAAELDGDRTNARIWLGAPLHADDLEELFGGDMTTADRSGWDPRISDVVDVRERRLGAIVVNATRRPPAAGGAPMALIEGIGLLGLGVLPWTAELERLRCRLAFARRVAGEDWADVSDEALLADLDAWLKPWLAGRARRADLAGVEVGEALWNRVGWARRAELDVLAPAQLTMPSGQRKRVEYPPDASPYVVVRVQELFGTTVTPTVAHGAVPVQLHLTSPAGRPVQVTSDLASFWATTYPQVRGELRARYPRHPWPEDPLTAMATSRATPRRR
ncbi:MAG: ATP-dependent helicase HrpB [Acidimicrobiaceae bacterium]|jgi:ATP-dependent helicase HrpB|nr:ATP-dependent helicase HrpB [Acidimicrobiaceae bacterium]